MSDLIIIQNSRAFALHNYSDDMAKFFCEGSDLTKKPLKATSFKVYTNFVGKILALLGFSVKIEANGGKIVYVNKKSLVNQTSRLFVSSETTFNTMNDWVKNITDIYTKPSKLSEDHKKMLKLYQKIGKEQLKMLTKKPFNLKLVEFTTKLSDAMSNEYKKQTASV